MERFSQLQYYNWEKNDKIEKEKISHSLLDVLGMRLTSLEAES